MSFIELNLISVGTARENLAWDVVDKMSPLEMMLTTSIMTGIEEESSKGEKSYRFKLSNLLEWSHLQNNYELAQDKVAFLNNTKIMECLGLLGYTFAYGLGMDEIVVIWGI